MKINNLTFILLLGVILSGIVIAGYISTHKKEEIKRLGNQNEAPTSEIYTPGSISKETILLLLSVGVVGALGLNRKRKRTINSDQKNEPNMEAKHQNFNEKKLNH